MKLTDSKATQGPNGQGESSQPHVTKRQELHLTQSSQGVAAGASSLSAHIGDSPSSPLPGSERWGPQISRGWPALKETSAGQLDQPPHLPITPGAFHVPSLSCNSSITKANRPQLGGARAFRMPRGSALGPGVPWLPHNTHGGQSVDRVTPARAPGPRAQRSLAWVMSSFGSSPSITESSRCPTRT